MAFTAEPIAGEWYRDIEKDQDFEIMAVDEYEGMIDIRRQGADENEQISLDEWDEMPIEPADSPARGSLEDDFSMDDVVVDEETETGIDADRLEE